MRKQPDFAKGRESKGLRLTCVLLVVNYYCIMHHAEAIQNYISIVWKACMACSASSYTRFVPCSIIWGLGLLKALQCMGARFAMPTF
jgi:hypothetical protein